MKIKLAALIMSLVLMGLLWLFVKALLTSFMVVACFVGGQVIAYSSVWAMGTLLGYRLWKW